MISNIIPTYNRSYFLQQHLESLNDQTQGNFEVIVVSDGSTDNTAELIQDIQVQYKLRFYELPKNGYGLARSRNYGVSLAKNDTIVLTDDDMIVPSNYIELYARSIQPGTCIVGASERTRGWNGSEPWYAVGSNCGFMKDDFNRVDGYDEQIPGYGYEDSDFGYRLYKAGIKIVYKPQIFVEHIGEFGSPGNPLYSLAEHQRRRAQARESYTYLMKKYGARFRKPFKV